MPRNSTPRTPAQKRKATLARKRRRAAATSTARSAGQITAIVLGGLLAGGFLVLWAIPGPRPIPAWGALGGAAASLLAATAIALRLRA